MERACLRQEANKGFLMHDATHAGIWRRFGALVLTAALLLMSDPIITRASQAQATAQEASSKPVLTEETYTISQGWAYLTAGDTAKALSFAEQVLAKYPRSIAAAALRIEAAIAHRGGQAGLTAYEQWLGSRKLEDGYLLRRAARAILWETATDPGVGVEALQHLAEDDDPEARAQLVRRMVAGSLGDMRAMARLGDPNAINFLIKQIESGEGSKLTQIDALIQSKSPLAIPPLIRLLKAKNYPTHMAAAADGLGTLNATQAIPALRELYGDQSQLGSVRFMAAVGLFKMGDMTGIAMLRQRLFSDVPHLSIGTALLMASRPDGEWQTVVRKGLSDPDPTVRVMAADLLALVDREAARASLEQLLLDDNPVIREKASQSMVRKIAGDFGTLRRFLRSGDLAARVAAGGRVLELTR